MSIKFTRLNESAAPVGVIGALNSLKSALKTLKSTELLAVHGTDADRRGRFSLAVLRKIEILDTASDVSLKLKITGTDGEFKPTTATDTYSLDDLTTKFNFVDKSQAMNIVAENARKFYEQLVSNERDREDMIKDFPTADAYVKFITGNMKKYLSL